MTILMPQKMTWLGCIEMDILLERLQRSIVEHRLWYIKYLKDDTSRLEIRVKQEEIISKRSMNSKRDYESGTSIIKYYSIRIAFNVICITVLQIGFLNDIINLNYLSIGLSTF